jgi:hypothetical protein
MIAAHLDAGQLAEAIAASRQLLQGAQQRLPDDLESAMQAASLAWDQDQPEVSRDKLAAALALAHDLHYF